MKEAQISFAVIARWKRSWLIYDSSYISNEHLQSHSVALAPVTVYYTERRCKGEIPIILYMISRPICRWLGLFDIASRSPKQSYSSHFQPFPYELRASQMIQVPKDLSFPLKSYWDFERKKKKLNKTQSSAHLECNYLPSQDHSQLLSIKKC